MKVWIARLLGLALCLPMLASAAPNLRAWLDRDSARLGESVTLNVEAEGRVGGEPDFSALDADFRRLGTQSSQQTSISNGAATSKTLWAVALEPKREGQIIIPALSIDGASTQPIVLSVQPQPAGAQGKPGDEVFLEASADPHDPQVQQQVRYSIKLYYAFDLSDGNMGEPTVAGVVARRTGQDKRYSATLGSQRYNVIERNYALTPEQSGTLTIPAIEFRGSALDARNPGNFFNRGRLVTARSDAITLTVAAKPANWGSAPWLPAAELTLSEDSQFPAQIHVGDALTRSVRLQAKGLAHEQLPDPEFAAVAGIDIYPDKAQTATRDDGSWIYGERQRKFAFVPNKAGTITLPGLSVRWFNTTTRQAETATLPERNIEVLPATGSATVSPSAASAPDASGVTGNGAVSSPAIGTLGSAGAADSRWRIAAFVGFGLWLLTLALWFQRSRRAPSSTSAVPGISAVSTNARSAFLRSCALGDLAGAERGLIAWGRAERPGIHSLGSLASAVQSEQQQAVLRDLQRMRYSGVIVDGLAQQLTAAFKDGIDWQSRAAGDSSGSTPLPALYPTR